jgi:hypothetical protein
LPQIATWINERVSSNINHCPSELMYGRERPNVFRKIIPKEQWQDQEEDDIAKKIEQAYAKIKIKTLEREKKTLQLRQCRMEMPIRRMGPC